jgi:hypothetical protein
MDHPGKADPAIYPKLREHVLQLRIPNLADGAVHAVLMDWPVTNGMMTALAAADGTASIYLSSGGGYLGGGQRYPAIRQAAITAVNIADRLSSHFQPASTHDFPPAGEIFFYITTNEGVRFTGATEAALRARKSPLGPLGAAMQEVITQYRLAFEKPKT